MKIIFYFRWMRLGNAHLTCYYEKGSHCSEGQDQKCKRKDQKCKRKPRAPKYKSEEEELVVDWVTLLGKFCEPTILTKQELVLDWLVGKSFELNYGYILSCGY